MVRVILAFLACVSSVGGQDVILTPADFGSVRYLQGDPDLNTAADIGEGFGPLTSRAVPGSYPELRFWERFDLSGLKSDVASALLRFPVSRAVAIGREIVHQNMHVTIRNSGLYYTPHFMPRLTDEEWLSIFDDAGTGTFYGAFDISYESVPGWELDNDLHQPRRLLGESGVLDFEMPLSGFAVHDINAARGGEWAFGVSLPPLPPLPPLGPPDQHRPEFAGVNTSSVDSWQLMLTYGPPPPLGDFSGNGRVDQSDLDFVLLNWGVVDQEELDAVLLTWGDGGLAAASVPEPSGVWIAAVVAIMAGTFRRRKCPH